MCPCYNTRLLTSNRFAAGTDSVKAKARSWHYDKVKSSKKSEALRIYQILLRFCTALYSEEQLNRNSFIRVSQSWAYNSFLNQSMHRANFIFSPRKSYDKIELAISNTNFYYDEKIRKQVKKC
jgi:hypothetical protein